MFNLASVVMATYNGSKFLSQQLDSIVNQDYPYKELIIVDDCSTDETITILEEYARKYSWITFFVNEHNLGVTKTFMNAIAKAKGDYILFCDQDDIWFSDKITKLIANIDDNLLIHSDAKLIDDSNIVFCDSFFKEYKKNNVGGLFVDYLLATNVTGCCTMISRKLLELALPIPNDFYIHDHYFALIASYYNKIKYLPEQLVLYRQHGSNVMGASKCCFDVFLESALAFSKSYDSLLSKDFSPFQQQIELLRDYKLSIYNGRWKSKYSILRFLKIKNGWSRIIYFYLITGFSNKRLARLIYNKINKV